VKRVVLSLLAVAACGDNLTVTTQIEATSGARIKLELYLYEDGTEQIDTTSFYDTRLHTRCAPRPWSDELVRCVPDAAEALYTDSECTAAIGVAALPSGHPMHPLATNVSHFIGYDWVGTTPQPMRLYSTLGNEVEPVASYYIRQDGACIGPRTAPAGATYYEIDREIDPAVMPVVEQTELGAGRLALRALTTTDGLHVPTALYDRVLGQVCTPTLRTDGLACEPIDSRELSTAEWFLDDACSAPALVIGKDDRVPPLIRAPDSAGCASYGTLGPETTATTYAREGNFCVPRSPGEGTRVFALGEPIELARLDRTIEELPARRLAQVTLQDREDAELRFTAEHLVDRAIRSECRRELVGDKQRCVPATITPLLPVYASGCTIPIAAVSVPARACTPNTFASGFDIDGAMTLHAIGDVMTSPVYTLVFDVCVPYTLSPGNELRSAGPALLADSFLSAVSYGDR
jgi:hypothetical protein